MNFDMMQIAAYKPNNEEPRPFVRFEMRSVEDRTKPSSDGVTQLVDKAWAIIRAAGSKDSLEKPAEEWLASLKDYAKNGRVPQSWPHEYAEAFRLWKSGEELPVNGTAIKSWPPLSPAQRQMLISLGVLTVETLATCNDEILNRIGMGGHTLKALANTWLNESKDKGSMSKQLEAAMVKLEELTTLVTAQAATIQQLQAAAPPAKVTATK
jgi:hypothetical protein